MKIRMIRTAQQFMTESNDARAALLTTFSHFASLIRGVDSPALAEAMIYWVTADLELQRAQPGVLTGQIVGMLWSATTEDYATVEFAHRSVTLRIPTSGTKISLGFSSGSYIVEVDFGAEGSETRAVSILTTAELNHVQFQAYDLERQPVKRRDMLNTLADDAQRRHDHLVTCPESEFPSALDRDRAIHRLHALVGFFNASS